MTASVRRGTTAVLLGIGLVPALTGAGTAMAQAPAQPPPLEAVPVRGPKTWAPPPISVEFGGGTIEEYIQILSKAAPDLNVVIRPETKNVLMPPLSLKEVAHGTALQLIPALADSGEEIAITPILGSPGAGSEVFVIGVKTAAAQPLAGPSVARRVMTYGPGQPAKSVRVFSLGALTSGPDALKPETVLTAIDTALALQDTEQSARIKLHAESGLLVVHGDPAQIDAVEQVLTTLENDRRMRGAAHEETLRAENAKLMDMVKALETRIADLEGRLERAEQPEKDEKGKTRFR